MNNTVITAENTHYAGWTEIVENIARFFLVGVQENFNRYVDKINSLSGKDLTAANGRIAEIEKAIEEHKAEMNKSLDNVRELRRKAVELYDKYRETKVPYELFSRVFEETPTAVERNKYASIIREREGYLSKAKELWSEIKRITDEYDAFMLGKGDYVNSLKREKKNVENRIAYQFQSGLGGKLLNDRGKIIAILSSDKMIDSFNYFFRSICTGIYPDFFCALSDMDREEITSMFFTMLIEKGNCENIEFARLVYNQDEDGKFTGLYSDDEIYNSFFKGYYSTIRGLFIKSLKRYQNENMRLVRVDGIKFSEEDGETGNHGYDLVSNGQFESDKDMTVGSVKTNPIDIIEVKDCWDKFYAYLNTRFDDFVDVIHHTFCNKDKFYQVYNRKAFESIARYVIDNLDFEIKTGMYSAKRIKAFVYSAFGGSRSRTYNAKETQTITQIIVMFLCEYIYKFGSDSRTRKSGFFYEKVKNLVKSGISETWRSSGNIFNDRVNDYIAEFEKKHNFFFGN